MVTFIKLVCPNCGANLDVDSKLSQCFCQYCGVKILLHNENEHTVNLNIDHTNRYIDEAGLAEQENERRKIEFEQRKYEDKKLAEKEDSKGSVKVFAAFGLIFMTIYLSLGTFAGFKYGGILNFLKALLCAITGIAGWYGYNLAFDETGQKKSIGTIILVTSIILFIICLTFISSWRSR